jgi:Lrp/AsnC family transcriptional regulator for asnA, asnC and gidA
MKINSMVVEIDGIDKEILRFLMEMPRNQSFKSNRGKQKVIRAYKLEQLGDSGSKFVVNHKVLVTIHGFL